MEQGSGAVTVTLYVPFQKTLPHPCKLQKYPNVQHQIKDPGQLRTSVLCALSAGYRHIDTAAVYKVRTSFGLKSDLGGQIRGQI